MSAALGLWIAMAFVAAPFVGGVIYLAWNWFLKERVRGWFR
jgi:hypothetical protein